MHLFRNNCDYINGDMIIRLDKFNKRSRHPQANVLYGLVLYAHAYTHTNRNEHAILSVICIYNAKHVTMNILDLCSLTSLYLSVLLEVYI